MTDAQIASYAGETLPGKWISDRDVYAEGTTPTAGAQVVYALATPVTYQLTAQEVRTLLGANNIWADTGDTTVQYRADPTRYIDKRLLSAKSLLAGVEAGFTATRNYAAGSLLIVEDRLYKTTAAIANGGAITPGTNTADTTVAEQLTLLANT